MPRLRLVLGLALIGLLTMGLYLHFRVRRAIGDQLRQEMGRPGAPGQPEFFLADTLLTAKDAAPAAGNSAAAQAIAAALLERFDAPARERVALPAARDPLGVTMPRAYCLLRDQCVILLVYVPGLAGLTLAERQQLAAVVWPLAQALARERVPGHPTVGFGLRGPRVYGPLVIGGRAGRALYAQDGGRYVLYGYFAGEPALQPAPAPAQAAR